MSHSNQMPMAKQIRPFLFLAWLFLTGFIPYSEGTRLYIGTDRKVDWIEVGCLYDNRTGQEWAKCWCDDSAIQRITPVHRTALTRYRDYIIDKAHSIWKLRYFSSSYTDASLTLIEPREEAVEQCSYVP